MTEVLVGAQFLDRAVTLLNSAQQSVRIIVFDWRVYPHDAGQPVNRLALAVVAAKKRGIDVRILINSDIIRNHLKNMGVESKRCYHSNLVHAKVMIVDGRYAIVGSHNYTQAAMSLNLEVSVLVDFENPENDLTRYYDRLWGV